MNKETNPPKLSRKEQERLQRRDEILKAARKFFLEKGFFNTTLDEIAQQSEFGKGTLYNYFASKKELLWGLIEQFSHENIAIAERAIERQDGSTREKFRNYARTVLSLGEEHEFFHMLIKESHAMDTESFDERMKVMMNDIVQIWQVIARPLQMEMDAGRIKQGDALQMAGLFDLMVRTFGMGTQRKHFPIKEVEQDTIIELVISTFFDGVAIHSTKGPSVCAS